MTTFTKSEAAALEDAEPLLRFAAERVKDLDPDLPLAIAEARLAKVNDAWDPKISQRFWIAFAKLTDLITPVTIDNLRTANKPISAAQKSSKIYMCILVALIIIFIPLQLYVWVCTNLSGKIDVLLAAERTRFASLGQEYSKIETQFLLQAATRDAVPPMNVPFAQAVDAVHDGLSRIAMEARLLVTVSMLGKSVPQASVPVTCADPRDLKDGVKYEPLSTCIARGATALPRDYYSIVSVRMSAIEVAVQDVKDRVDLVTGVIGGYFLPLLLGAIGAVAFIIRSISEQIRTTTFSSSSPTRHVMRLALGAMAGLVVGLFGNLSTKLSLPPLAIAFLAGYGVEAVFSMFDAFLARFKA